MYDSAPTMEEKDVILYPRGKKTYCLDKDTGKDLWQLKTKIVYLDSVNNLGLGYRYSSYEGFTNELEAINLSTGKVNWRVEIENDFGWDDLFYLNDSTLIITAAGIHSININNGDGWDYNTITGHMDFKKNIATSLLGFATGGLTGAIVMSNVAKEYELVRISSNLLLDDQSFFLASKEKISKIDFFSGEIKWSFSFLKKQASKSSLFLEDEVIYLVNYGYSFKEERQIEYGIPFIMAFDPISGQQYYQLKFEKKHDPILDFELIGEDLFLIFKNRIAKYDLKTGSLVDEVVMFGANEGSFQCLTSDNVYYSPSTHELRSLTTESSMIFVEATNGTIYKVDYNLEVRKIIDVNELSTFQFAFGKNKVVADKKYSWIINSKGIKIAKLPYLKNYFVEDNFLWFWKSNKIISIDLTELTYE